MAAPAPPSEDKPIAVLGQQRQEGGYRSLTAGAGNVAAAKRLLVQAAKAKAREVDASDEEEQGKKLPAGKDSGTEDSEDERLLISPAKHTRGKSKPRQTSNVVLQKHQKHRVTK